MTRRTNPLCAGWGARAAWALAVVLALVASSATVPAAEKATKPSPEAKAPASETPAKAKEAPPALAGENAVLAREAGLDEKQKRLLAETVAEANAAIKKWHEANRQAIDKANQALAAARLSGDPTAIQKALADARPLLEKRREIQEKFEKKIMAILTPEQEGRWLGYVLYRQLTGQAQALGLSDAQHKQTRSLCDEAGKKLAALPPAEKATEADARQAMTIQRGLVDRFIGEVLTEAQRAQLRGPAPSGPAPVEGPPPAEKKTPEEAGKAPPTPKSQKAKG